ncbi:MAG: hypothetical protein ABFD64_03475 [Armatimonadota bacterium]
MSRTVVLAYWEFVRLLRSRKTVFAALAVPVAGVAVCVSHLGRGNLALRCFFPAAAVLFTWLLLYVRSLTDRSSGFSAGIDSTPAAGAVSFIARLLIALVIILVQIAVFYAAIRIIN